MDERGPQQWACAQIERPLRLKRGQYLKLGLARCRRQSLQRQHRHGQSQACLYDLDGPTFDDRERRAQGLMPLDNFVEALGEGGDVELAA